MSKRKGVIRSIRSTSASSLTLGDLRRETKTALDLALIALAPSALLERLATSAGMLEALMELPANSPPALALMPGLLDKAQAALDEWHQWQQDNLAAKMARG
jgi:hypothetical protein